MKTTLKQNLTDLDRDLATTDLRKPFNVTNARQSVQSLAATNGMSEAAVFATGRGLLNLMALRAELLHTGEMV